MTRRIYMRVLLCGLMLLAAATTAQEIEWENTYTIGWPHKIIELSDGGFAFFGSEEYYGGSVGFMLRLSADGDSIRARVLGDSTLGLVDMERSDDDGFIVCGTRHTDRRRHFVIMKLDSLGEVEWESTPVHDAVARGLAMLRSGRFVAIIKTSDFSVHPYPGACIGFSADGDSLWSVSMNNDTMTARFDQVIAPANGDLVVWGLRGSGPDDTRAFSSGISEDGKVRWINDYNRKVRVDYAPCLTDLQDSTFVLGSSRDGQAFIFRFAPWGRYLGSNEFGSRAREAVSAIAATSDGGFVVCTNRYWDPHSLWEQFCWADIIKYDTALIREWTMPVDSAGRSVIPVSIAQTSDGGFICAAAVASSSGGPHRMHAIKLRPIAETATDGAKNAERE